MATRKTEPSRLRFFLARPDALRRAAGSARSVLLRRLLREEQMFSTPTKAAEQARLYGSPVSARGPHGLPETPLDKIDYRRNLT